jgi:thiosulfate/3-mercaptopyruvate sulfurtransferase
MPWLINAAQFDKFRKNQKNIIVLDASWYMPHEERNAKDEFHQRHIVGAKFLDLREFADPATDLPNMLLRDENEISQKLGALGMTNDFKILLYDRSPYHTSCRAVWMFKVFGHNPLQLYVLDGGLDAWEKYGGKIEEGEPRASSSKKYDVNYQAQYVRTLVQMKTNLHHPSEQVIDMRHPVRYAGGPEHRKGLRSGHIPGSYCFPYFSFFEPDGRWKPLEKIRKQLTGLGLDFHYPMVSTCGSGMTAAVLDFTLDILNHSNHAIYDGSWCEWGAEHLYHGEESLAERPVITSLDK